MNLFRKKLPDLHAAQALRKCLTAWDLTFLGIGNMIGAGIFVLPGVVAATQAGPAIILSFVVAGIACVFVALSYAELAASVGGCGGGYGYSYAAFGELPAWIVGWITASAAGFSVAAVANGWSGYVANAMAPFGIGLPEYLTKGPAAGGVVNLPAVLIVLVLMMVLIAGVNQSAKLNTVIVAIKLLAIALFVGVALFHIRGELWQPFLPFGWFDHTPDGKTVGVLAGAAIVFFAYIGFQNVSVAAEEAQNPQRDVPLGTLAAVIICALLYIAVSGLLTAIAPYRSLNVSSPIAYALLQIGVNWGSALVAVGIIVGLTSPMLITYYAGTRILFAMARDGLLPSGFLPGQCNDPNSGQQHHRLRNSHCIDGRAGSVWRAHTAFESRPSHRVHAGVPGRDRAASDKAGHAPAVQSARRSYLAGTRDALLLGIDHVPPARDARAFCAVSRDWTRRLFRLRRAPQPRHPRGSAG